MNPKAAWKVPGDFSPTRSESPGALDRIGGVAPSPSDTPLTSHYQTLESGAVVAQDAVNVLVAGSNPASPAKVRSPQETGE
jgi:hypothetical protein